MSENMRERLEDVGAELIGNILVAVATCNVALYGEFPLSGFNGIAMLVYRLFHIPMGLMLVLMNILPAWMCRRVVDRSFFLKTARCMLIQLVLIDYVAPMFPAYQGDRLLAALMTGVLYGIGYGIIYSRGSSSGGADFVMILVKSRLPHVKAGTINFVMDFGIVIGSGLFFGDLDGIIYGLVINYIMCSMIDHIILGMNAGNVALIVTDHGHKVCQEIDSLTGRGSTILHAEGGYKGDPRDVVLVAGTARDISAIRRSLAHSDPGSFTIIMESNEVNGEGFRPTRIAGE